MARKGGLSSKFYRETPGLKASGGQVIKAGAMLTRNGDRWKPGINVIGRMNLTSVVAGQVYFTRKRGSYGKPITVINVRPVEQKAPPQRSLSAKVRKAPAAKKAKKV